MQAITLDTPRVSVYRVPTDAPESDGTLAWNSTTLMLVEFHAGGKHGLGYTYADTATGALICDTLAASVAGDDAFDIAAGEYGYDAWYFRYMLEAGAVDVLQADATRCAGITGFLQAAAIANTFQRPLSAHCAPSIHAHPACATPCLRHIEYFHDHVRVEHMLFDGVLTSVHGALCPDLSRPGMGLEFKRNDALQYAI